MKRSTAALLSFGLGLTLLASGVHGQTLPASEGATAEVSVTAAPPEIREVVAEGRAVIDPEKGGVLGARRAAHTLALRNAVEKAVGVYVAARTLSQNYQMVRDQVVTRSDGFATLKEVVKEEVGKDTVRVVIRAEVSLKPLTEQLTALKLTRIFRVYVAGGERKSGVTDAAVSALQRRLAEAGFTVSEAGRDADVVVRVLPAFSENRIDLETAAGPMAMHSVQGQLTVRAAWSGTGEIVAAFTASDTAAHINREKAQSQTVTENLEALAPRLVDALMVLPAREAQPVTLVVGNLSRAGQVARLEDALNTLPGVRNVLRRSYADGRATWELEVFNDALPLVSRALEEGKALRQFGLTVSEETRARIVAAAGH